MAIQRDEAPNDKSWAEKAAKLWGEVKETSYSWMIEKLRGVQRVGVAKLRSLVQGWPPARKDAAEAVIGGCEFITDLLISLLLAVIGLVAGLVSGLVRFVWGLFNFLVGIITTLLLFIAGFFGQQYRDEFDQRMRDIGRAITNIGPALVGLKDRWIVDWNKASTDRKTIMIGELTGEIEALLVSIWAGGQAASAMPKITVPLPQPALAALGPGALEGGAVTVAAGPPVVAGGLTGAMASSIDDAGSGGTKTKAEPKAPTKTSPPQQPPRPPGKYDEPLTPEDAHLTPEQLRQKHILEDMSQKQRDFRGGAKQESATEWGMKEAKTPGRTPPAYLERGQLAHKYAELLIPEDQLPRGLKAEVPADLPGGRVRLDRVDFEDGVYYEIKPTTQAQAGADQIAKYAEYMNKNYPLPGGKQWIGRVVLYETRQAIGLFGF